MGLFDIIKRLFGGGQRETPAWCPQCGAPYAWDGRPCPRCNYAGPALNAPRQAPPRPAAARTAPTPPPPPKQVSLSGLDVSKFQPLTVGEAKDLVDQSPNFQSAYFDPLNIIPDENLPRIQVIDRTMVGLGLISVEELARIHEVGKQMNELRGSYQAFAQQARAAVQRSKEDRERIKARKKQEAEARRQQRAADIAHRRQTDIVFLGRGVSRGLADRRSNVEKLQANGLPVLSTPAEVAKALSLPIPKLRWLAFHSEASRSSHYVTFTVPKKSGGLRQLAAPQRTLAATQTWILENVLNKLPMHDAAHGFVVGRSTLTNATPHVGAAVVVNADLTDFFPTITFFRVMGVFQSMGYSPAVATILGLLCTECPRREVRYAGEMYHAAVGPRGLPQGACTSPALSNLTARRLDARLNGIARKLSWTYTRYADDMTFSAPAEAAGKTGYLLACLRHICQEEGFAINEKKTRILRQNAAQTVTGVVVNERPGAPRKLVRRLRAILHRAEREGLDPQNRDGHPHFDRWLRGMLAYVHMLNPDQARALYEAYHRVAR